VPVRIWPVAPYKNANFDTKNIKVFALNKHILGKNKLK